MGGCRCTFRECPNNSSNSPGMHFFHFPNRQLERCKLWAKYSNNEDFISLPASKLRNKVICESHFRDECFMNYKKERLVKHAVPTLTRLQNRLVLDYEESTNPTPKVIAPTISEHLVPPEKRQSIENENMEIINMDENIDENNDSVRIAVEDLVEDLVEFPTEQNIDHFPPSVGDSGSSDEITEFLIIDNDLIISPSPPTISMPPVKKPKVYSSAPKILNQDASMPSRKFPKKDKKPVQTVSLPEVKTSSQVQILKTVKPVAQNTTLVTKILQLDVNQSLKTESDSIIDIAHQNATTNNDKPSKNEAQSPVKNDVVSKSIYLNAIADHTKEIAELKEMLTSKRNMDRILIRKETTQVGTVTTSSTNKPEPINPSSLTKSQLFNGIKKYLSPSMAALVRMEMFGGPDRIWKPDEKNVSVEILRLGEPIFNYFRDEWRFRLPPKKEVEQWLNACTNIEDEEDL